MSRLISALLLGALAVAPIAAAAQAEAPRRLTVSGTGEISAAPDMARVTLGVTREAESASVAAGQAAEAAEAVIEALEALGVGAREIATVEIGLEPVYERPDRDAPPALAGYRARHRLQVTLRALVRLGPAIDASISAGATDVGGVSFDLAKADALRDEARRLAVADAAAAARLLAEASGARLGALQSLSLGRAPEPAPRRMAVRAQVAAMADTPVAPGEVTLRETVTAVYRIE